ncbi:family 16 glycoside hydrolase [Dictyobacter kobayashii]|uniref:3-keto-alpha-glucoside-1,2-lyase/3-keto-2-hydroxy-glucal hydratase domain-containing protein n=1 Tax=Dictyobacter kobayashii TaxID=2014872 RepID=A0A402AKU1_9CHLR|nr:family 16 glycoside hydrolase [Dictyobacter kobayashii]GCE19644.1 hypothetical protein KDK_34440 [Dictyobacter kobayashii]
MQNCPNCEKLLSPGMTRCPYCRYELPMPAAEDSYHIYYTGAAQATRGHASYNKNGSEPYGGQKTLQSQRYVVSVATAPTAQAHMSQQSNTLSGIILGAIVLLVLLLIASGVSLLYYATVTHPIQLHTQATATARAVHVANVQSSATARTQATQSAINQKWARATVAAQATAQAKATAIALKNIYVQSTSGQPVIDSSLLVQTSQKWDIYPTKDGGGCAFTDGALHSSVFQNGFYAPCIAHATHFQNFALEVQMTILQGDEGGIIFRSNNHDKNFYSFRLKTDGTYGLILTRNDGHTIPLVYDKSKLIRTGADQTNTLTIIARGDNIYLYINKQYVGSASDDTYEAGTIGVIALALNHGTTVAFNNLRVWQL